jgi:septum formation topological specificity factor MinE
MKEQLNHVRGMLASDRLGIKPSDRTLLEEDLNRVLKQYFKLEEEVEIGLKFERGMYTIKVFARAREMRPILRI